MVIGLPHIKSAVGYDSYYTWKREGKQDWNEGNLNKCFV